MNIEGLSEKIITRFYQLGLIKTIIDIYNLEQHREIIINLNQFGNKLFDNIINAINRSKNNSLERLLFALSIRHLGQKSAQEIARNYHHLNNIANATIEELQNLADIGIVIATSLYEWMNLPSNKILIKQLALLGINMKYINDVKINPDNFFYQKKVVITGKLSKSRDIIKSELENLGADVINSVTNKTDYLLIGIDPGTKKFAEAKKLKIKIITEEQFQAMKGQ